MSPCMTLTMWSELHRWLGPFYGAIAVPSVTRCRCRRRCRCCCGHRCACGDTWWMAMRRAAARSGEWAQHFSNASCVLFIRLIVHLKQNSHRRRHRRDVTLSFLALAVWNWHYLAARLTVVIRNIAVYSVSVKPLVTRQCHTCRTACRQPNKMRLILEKCC